MKNTDKAIKFDRNSVLAIFAIPYTCYRNQKELFIKCFPFIKI